MGRNITSVTDREISIVQGQCVLCAMLVEALHRSLKQSEAPIVSKSSGVLHQIIETLEGHFVSSRRLDFQLGRFP